MHLGLALKLFFAAPALQPNKKRHAILSCRFSFLFLFLRKRLQELMSCHRGRVCSYASGAEMSRNSLETRFPKGISEGLHGRRRQTKFPAQLVKHIVG